MRAGLRFNAVLLSAGLVLLPMPSLAQNSAEPATNTPATDAVGPRELQNFSLPGTRTQQAEQAPASPPPAAPRTEQPRTAATPQSQAQSSPREPSPKASTPARTASVVTKQPPTTTLTGAFPPPPRPPQLTPQADAPSALSDQPATAAPAPLAPDRRPPFWPWLAAALVLAGGTIFLFRRHRQNTAFAGPDFDLRIPRVPAPPVSPRVPQPQTESPAPAPIPPKPPTGVVSSRLRAARPPSDVPSGIVSSRLRPTLEIGVQPLRCIVDDDQVAIEFEVDLYNAGSAPARAVLAEASLFNPGEAQDEQLAAFFANPTGVGNPLDAIAPLKRVTMTSQVVAPRANIQEFDVGGRKSFVPVIAFNALYEWSGGKGQTSAAYLVGRETGHDKLGPLHVDNGAREFLAVGARPLPTALRT